jgi:hypothetical protein
MKIKRDPETLKQLRETLRWHPGVIPNLDQLSDEEMADSVERFMTGMNEAITKLRVGMEKAAAEMTQALRPSVEWAREVEAKKAAAR